MELKPQMTNLGKGGGPNKPEKDIPLKPDKNPDPTKPRPGVNEPNKVDPTRIEEPPKTDPTRIQFSQPNSRVRKWTKVSGWDEVLERMKNA